MTEVGALKDLELGTKKVGASRPDQEKHKSNDRLQPVSLFPALPYRKRRELACRLVIYAT